MSSVEEDFNYKYSILMPVYIKDNPEWLKISIESMLNQTILADEFLIIKDGEVTDEIDKVLMSYKEKYPKLFTIHQMSKNVGLGKVLAYGIKECKNEFIVRMDADDYSVKERCEKQLNIFRRNKYVDVVGSNVEEFSESIDNIISHVILPENHEQIIKFAKKRCPIRHPALMYKKSSVLDSGNYSDYYHAQDYNLVVKMIMKGYYFYNIQEPLTYMRVTSDFYKRRGGVKQLKIIYNLKKEFYEMKFYSFNDFFLSTVGNGIVCLLPNFIRELIYIKILRK